MLRTSAALALVFAACATEPAPECATAVERVAACYGDETAAAFAESCDAATAAIALAEDCTLDDGKADSSSTPILSPASEHFKYGSIGADKLGIPVSILKAVPIVCADTLPPGTDPRRQPLAAFGM